MEATMKGWRDGGLSDLSRDAEKDPDGSLIWWQEEAFGDNVRKVIPWSDDPYREAPKWAGTRVTLKSLGKNKG